MPRSMRDGRTTRMAQRPFLTQQSYALGGHQSMSESRCTSDEVMDAASLITYYEAWAVEAFKLPSDFLHSLSEPMAKKSWAALRGPRSRSNGAKDGDTVPFLQEVTKRASRQMSWAQATPKALENPQRTSQSRKQPKVPSDTRAKKEPSAEEDADVFDFLSQMFGFQRDSVRNQRDNAITILGSRLARSMGQDRPEKDLTPDVVAGVLAAWRKEQLANYKKWCRHVWTWQIKLTKVIPNDPRLACAFEIALNLLLWGEAANLRLCPEFLCWAHHKTAKRLKDAIAEKAPQQMIRSYLKEVIRPCYLTLAEQYENTRAGARPYVIKNYDDFNEAFWQRGCLGLDVVGLTQNALRKKFIKTFVERQSWLVPMISFWRVQTMLFFGLHLLIVAAFCTTGGGCPGDNPTAYWHSPVLTLAVCYVLVDAYEIVFVTWRKIFVQCHLLTVVSTLGRAFLKGVVLVWLVTNYPSDIFINSARLYVGLVGLLELLKFTPLIGKLQGTVGPWSVVINVLLGVDAAGTYARIDRLPGKRKVLLYSLFWVVVLTAKFLFNFFFMIKPLVSSSRTVWNLDIGGRYDLGFVTFQDTHNIGILVGLWMSVGFVYFIDLQVWFVLAESVTSACFGVARRVGERLNPAQTCNSFEKMYGMFFKYMNLEDQEKHFRFAYVWNEVVNSMRKEDIISDREMSGLKYFVVSLHRSSNVLALLPGFLVSGKIQASVKTAKAFAKQNDELIKHLTAVDAWGKGDERRAGYEEADRRKSAPIAGFLGIIDNLGMPDAEHGVDRLNDVNANMNRKQLRLLQKEQRKFLRGVSSSADPIREVSFLHLFLSLFFLMEHLCGSQAICEGLWNLYEFATSLSGTGDDAPGSAVDALMEASPDRPLFLLHAWPDVVSAVEALVRVLLDKKRSTARNVQKAMEKLCQAMAALLDPTDSGAARDGRGLRDQEEGYKYEGSKLVNNLGKLQTALTAWAKLGKISQEEVDALHKDYYEFLIRFHSLVASTNRPGYVESWECQRRITFFVNSMFMSQPQATRVENMPGFSTLTPYYSEEVILSLETLCSQTADGVTTLEYLQTLFPQQWTALVERMRREMPHVDFLRSMSGGRDTDVNTLSAMDQRARLELQLWASYRAQTLARTVRGMMYYEQAIRLLAVVEAEDFSQELYRNVHMGNTNPLYDRRDMQAYVSVLQGQLKYSASSREVSKAKFTYVVSCQQHAKLLRSQNEADREKAKAVELLMKMHPALKIAYVESARDGRHFSVLIRYDEARSRIVKQYEVELPGPILVGEGKPNNQNHAIIFTRGEAVQAIDMNQDGALEDALKIRQLLGEFRFNTGGNRARIVGFREFVFTHGVSSIANFFSLQELSFVTSIQRFLDKPLSIRFHYGHPDMFDKVSAITLGGISKASKGINLSEDIFGGFNFVLRGGKATQAEYIQVGKGRDVGLGQITGFTAKVSMGNGMQARSREVHRIAQQLDFFRLLSFFYSSVGFYLNQVFLILSIWLFMYAKVFLVFDSRTVDLSSIDPVVARVVSTEYIFQLGFMLVVPVFLVIAVETGLARAVRKFVEIILRGSVLFFVFLSATNAHYVNKAFLTGEAKYMSTGRGFVIVHDRFSSLFCRYLQSHFLPAFEILLLLIVYWHFGSKQSSFEFVAETFSVWLLVIAWLWSPMIFNPNGVEWLDVIRDFDGWLQWMAADDDDPDKSWHAWWTQQNAELGNIMFRKKVVLCVWRCRFLLLVWGFLSAIRLSREEKSMPVLETRWLMVAVVSVLAIFLVLQCLSGIGGSTVGRLVGLIVFLALALGIGFLPVFDLVAFEQMFYFAGAVGFLLYFFVGQASLLLPVGNGGGGGGAGDSVVMWNTYRAVHMAVGLVIMIPVLVVAFFPFMTHFQTRMLFNQNFSARFTSAKMFAIERERQQAGGWLTQGTDEGGGGGGRKGEDSATSPPPARHVTGGSRPASSPPPQRQKASVDRSRRAKES